MIKFDIKNRFTGEVQFTADIDCDECEGNSKKIGLSVLWAIKNNVNLSGSNLSDSNLRYSNLRGCNLSGSNLSDCDLRYVASGNGREIKTIQTEPYQIVYTDTRMAIGCELHEISKWFDFDDETIHGMDDGALVWWTKWKPILKTIITSGEVK